eukprot:TRINITY_DN12325_c0_g1_i2.p1 TRINITY_DN12325_c0_g1~~TRINITY_DN12325_c0_g1_i2.p1  ORF type:complete len:440 (-),score=98.66 TRINITY_DN12325_c0_g1_i2:89-1408(-)
MGLDVVAEGHATTRVSEDADLIQQPQRTGFPKLSKSSWTLIACPILLSPLMFSSNVQLRVMGVTALMAIWWATEAIPLPATALLPLFLFPLLVISSAKQVAPNYCKDTSMLFLGGFIVAAAIEKVGLHTRIALKVLNVVGTTPDRILGGFMMVCWSLSMWMSNTATCVMMTPIIETIIQSVEAADADPGCSPTNLRRVEAKTPSERHSEHNPVAQIELHDLEESIPDRTLGPPADPGVLLCDQNTDIHKFGRQLCLGSAYACSVGGFATLTGTGPNIVFSGQFSTLFPKAPEVSFGIWLVFAMPLSFAVLVITFFMVRFHGRISGCKLMPRLDVPTISPHEVRNLLRDLGPVRWDEATVLICFGCLVVLWIFRQPEVFPGWGSVYDKNQVSDSTAVMIICVLPVSYTHLRAHETPEHLVCRLLLEKKKKTQKKKQQRIH